MGHDDASFRQDSALLGHDLASSSFRDLPPAAVAALQALPEGGLIATVGPGFEFPAMRFKASICLYVRKERVPFEIARLGHAFPELGVTAAGEGGDAEETVGE